MISVDEARAHLFALVSPLEAETIPLAQAAGRVLARDAVATRDQPPFAASSMDGYAMNSAEVELHAMFKLVGEAAAGKRFSGDVKPGQTVRIFTGAPMPEGTDFVVIQENTEQRGDLVTITDGPGTKSNIRPAGVDFKTGDRLTAPRRLSPSDVALLAAMNIADVPVTRRPVVALISNGNELVMPGEIPGPDQIIASNTFGLKALFQEVGAQVRMLPVARDTTRSLTAALELAAGADLVITIGGASVGDHDLVEEVTGTLGMERSFYKVLMRPGKPLMAGRLGNAAMIGLPGNPVSAMICGHIFVLPLLRYMLGLPDTLPQMRKAVLSAPLSENGPRAHYMRATLDGSDIAAAEDQDSSLLSVLARANALILRPPKDPARAVGEIVSYIPL
ncbi:molybdopterin molybdotransferase MoeA [Ruegeria sp. 2205SS24-7]|uniref:molybdopterin molybdotransferase MoeA n=1 Tax=Ruegeria discodermiae TaxID=3064389 RepID=UPI00274272F0|nr:gephyrin-like molybdotransferase Glp [Ruegeria sp. 2205SS24-7]MDP5216391.1 molybdopterin molybdotransferase MoeA [Ruegeria sp. 2205SS24-7]